MRFSALPIQVAFALLASLILCGIGQLSHAQPLLTTASPISDAFDGNKVPKHLLSCLILEPRVGVLLILQP